MHIKRIRFLRYVLIVINFLAVLYNASLYLFASKYVVSMGFSHSLLEKLSAIPTKPTVIFWSSVISFALLLLVMQIRNQVKEGSKANMNGLLTLEILLLLVTFVALQSSYNGLILLVFLDVFSSYTDFYIMQQRRYWLFFILLSFSALLVSNFDILSLVVTLPSLDT